MTETEGRLGRSALGFRDGDIAVVTGAASGIGRACAELLAAAGLVVAAWDIDNNRLGDVVTGIKNAGGRCQPVHCDVTDSSEIEAAWAETDALGATRYLVNNAGPPSSTSLSPADGMAAAAASMSAVGDSWIARAAEVAEAMTLTSSIAGTWAASGTPDWYPMSKAAIAAYGRQVAVKRRGQPRANTVQPGLTATPRMAHWMQSEAGHAIIGRIPLGRAGKPSEIASVIAFLLSPMASYVNGATVVVDGGSVL